MSSIAEDCKVLGIVFGVGRPQFFHPGGNFLDALNHWFGWDMKISRGRGEYSSGHVLAAVILQ